MNPYSLDLRERVYRACVERSGSVAEVTRMFGVSDDFFYKLQRQKDALGHLEPLPHGGGQRPRLNEEQEEHLRQWVQEKPDSTLAELAERCWHQERVRVSPPTLCRVLRKLKLTRKKRPAEPVRPMKKSGRNSGI